MRQNVKTLAQKIFYLIRHSTITNQFHIRPASGPVNKGGMVRSVGLLWKEQTH